MSDVFPTPECPPNKKTPFVGCVVVATPVVDVDDDVFKGCGGEGLNASKNFIICKGEKK